MTNRILIFLLLFFSYSFGFKIEQEFNIKTVKVTSQTIAKSKKFYGKTKADESRVYDINLRFDGFITKLFADKKLQYINKDDKLFSIYSKDIYNIFDELKLAKNSSKPIYNGISNKIKLYDILPSDYSYQNNEVVIKSKIDGFITKKLINNGSYIKKGQAIYELTDLNKIWVIAKVYQKDLSFIKKGMDAQITLSGIEDSFHATVDYIYPNINQKDQTIDVRLIVNNDKLLLFPNMFANIKLFEKKKTILTLPKNAVVRRDGKQYVFFKSGKSYEPSKIKAVKIGDLYHIIEGLSEDDEVVMNALFLLDSDSVTNGLYSNDDW